MARDDEKMAGIDRRGFLKLTGGILGAAGVYAILINVKGTAILDIASGQVAGDYDPSEHYWGFVINSHNCIGCGKCVVACKLENRVPQRDDCNRTWIERYQITDDGQVLVDSPQSGINGFVGKPSPKPSGEEPSIDKAFFVPKLCNGCDNSPCSQVCPVSATYKTKDGIVVVDQERCIGCGYCIQACPYGARYLIPADANRSPTGNVRVADKCNCCYHRITKGRLPACVEACPVGARVFGDLNDPESAVRKIMRDTRVTVLKPELGTKPKCYYVGLEEGVR